MRTLTTDRSPQTERIDSRYALAFDETLREGMDEVIKGRSISFDPQGRPVRFLHRPELKGFRITPTDDGVTVEYARTCEAYRALGILLGKLASGLEILEHEETCAFETMGFMLDTSRNGVPRVETVQRRIRQMALMGYNQLMLYTEDTYEIPDEPMFGYYRGRYTQEELRAIDAYAARFDIEVVPCIQTLAHLEQILQWPRFEPLKDDGGVLLAEDSRTYDLVEKMLRAASAPFRSKRIHIGMDEAHGIGAGRYRFQNGGKHPFEILSNHLNVVAEMCRNLGLSPMIWSDMYFRLGSKTNQYYDRATVISDEVAQKIPNDVELVYWDYYHLDEAFYDDWIARHRAMGKEPVFAAGIWMWNRFWAALPHSFGTIKAGLASARRNKLREVFVTAWGDDGTECDPDSILPALQVFAEECYVGTSDSLEVNFRGTCEMESSAWQTASDLEALPEYGDPVKINGNPAKWLLWHDPLLNFLDRHIPANTAEHYQQLSAQLRAMNTTDDPRLALAMNFAEVLKLKSDLHLSLRRAYQEKDTARITQLCESLPRLRAAVRTLWRLHRERWHENFKTFGWEVIELRYGGLLARLETLEQRLQHWLSTPTSPIEELEASSEMIYPDHALSELTLTHHRAASPSWLM
jgi:hypothetical protein